MHVQYMYGTCTTYRYMQTFRPNTASFWNRLTIKLNFLHRYDFKKFIN